MSSIFEEPELDANTLLALLFKIPKEKLDEIGTEWTITLEGRRKSSAVFGVGLCSGAVLSSVDVTTPQTKFVFTIGSKKC